jgi:DNA-binding CsgD family transcriptional regulator
MTKTVNGNSGGGTFRIDTTAGEIGLTWRGIIVATKEKRVYDWLLDYLGPYEEPRLTRREIEIVRCIAEGRTVGETAEVLTVSGHTVTNHLGSVYRKFGTRNRVEVLKLAVSRGILLVDELMTYTVQFMNCIRGTAPQRISGEPCCYAESSA